MSGPSTASPSPDRRRANRLAAIWKCPLFGAACRYILAVVFLMAAVTKITDPPEFTRQVVAQVHRLAPQSDVVETVAVWASTWLPWLELTAAACLFFGWAVREAAAILAVLLLLLLAYGLAVAGDEPDCGCYFFPRVGMDLPGWWGTVRNVLLMACAVRVASRSVGRGKPQMD